MLNTDKVATFETALAKANDRLEVLEAVFSATNIRPMSVLATVQDLMRLSLDVSTAALDVSNSRRHSD